MVYHTTRNQEEDAEERVQQHCDLYRLAEGQQPDGQPAKRAECEETCGDDGQPRAPLLCLFGGANKVGPHTCV
jgi:hypothetical protein